MVPYSILLLTLLFQAGISLRASFTQDNLLINNDLVHCTVKLIGHLNAGGSTVKIYGRSKPSLTDHIVHDLFQSDPPIPVTRTDTIDVDHGHFEHIWLTVVENPKQLESVMDMLHDVHHKRIIVCITYAIIQPLDELVKVASSSSIKALTRNVMFVVSNHQTAETWIIGVPEYNKQNCGKFQLIHVGHYRNDTLVKYIPNLFDPHVSDLGGCQLSVMAQPALQPYVETEDAINPGGFVGHLIGSLGLMMNFTPKYKWSSSNEALMDHVAESDLNLAVDLEPRPSTSETADSFSIGMVRIAFIAPCKKNRPSSYLMFIAPFQKPVWLAIALVLCAALGTSFIAKYEDSINLLLKIFGSLLGIAVGTFPRVNGMKIFLWLWLLSSFIITQSYLATLTQDFTVPVEEKTIHTVEELMDSEYDILCSMVMKKVWSNRNKFPIGLDERCRLVSDEYLDAFYSKFQKSGTMNSTALVVSLELLEAYVFLTDVQIINDRMISKHQFILVHSGSFYITAMGKYYNRLFASGLSEYWKMHQNYRNRRRFTNTKLVSNTQFITHCVGFLMIGLSVSFICFLAELIIHWAYSRSQ